MEIFTPLHPIRLKRLKSYIKRLPGLRVYYPMQEKDGGVVRNFAPEFTNTNNGTITGATIGVSGRVGRGVSFDGTNDKITFTGVTRTAGQPLSVFAICNPNITGTATPKVVMGVRQGDGAGDLWKLGIVSSTSVYTFDYDTAGEGVAASSAVTAVTNTPTLFAGVYDGQVITPYINGAAAGDPGTTSLATTDQTNGALGIRADDDTEDFAGTIQHAGYLNQPLTASQLLKMAQIAGLA